MSVDLLKNIADKRPLGAALLGLDVGKKTIGVALCDPNHSVATPLETIKRTKFTKDILRLQTLVEEYEVGGFVVGLPVNMDGSLGPRTQSVSDFCTNLLRIKDGPRVLWDERLSTMAVAA